jgi:chromosome segregation ATPase
MSELKEQIDEAVHSKPYFDDLAKGISFCDQLAAKDREIAALRAAVERLIVEANSLRADMSAAVDRVKDMSEEQSGFAECIAEQGSTIAALRKALGAAQKAMRPFEWASQYVDHRLVGEPMVKQFKDAIGKLTIGDFNNLALAVTRTSAALEMSGGVK